MKCLFRIKECLSFFSLCYLLIVTRLWSTLLNIYTRRGGSEKKKWGGGGSEGGNYKMAHLFLFLGLGLGQRTARIASSNTALSPFWVKAEHSRYLTARISLAMARPCGYVMGESFFSFSFSMVSLSSRRSSLVPTKMIGVFGQWCETSGNHCKHKRGELYYLFICEYFCEYKQEYRESCEGRGNLFDFSSINTENMHISNHVREWGCVIFPR